jgi:lysophospholipid acyltransferase (LPLAT)-like uncharacterized protein
MTRDDLNEALWAWALPHALRALAASWRASLEGGWRLAPDAWGGDPRRIFALWHGDALTLWPLLREAQRHAPVSVLVGPMRDARVAGQTLRTLGAHTVLGATGRTGAAGLVALKRALARGHSVALAVDGPAGPAYRARSGAVALSRETGVPLAPLGASASRAWTWREAWDQLRVPLPGAHVARQIGPLWVPPPGPRGPSLRAGLAHLQASLDALR